MLFWICDWTLCNHPHMNNTHVSMVWSCWGWFFTLWRWVKYKHSAWLWNQDLKPGLKLYVSCYNPRHICGLKLYSGKVTYRCVDYLPKMTKQGHMYEITYNFVSSLMKTGILDLLNIVVTDHGHRSYKGLGSELKSTSPGNRLSARYLYTGRLLESSLGSMPVREWGKLDQREGGIQYSCNSQYSYRPIPLSYGVEMLFWIVQNWGKGVDLCISYQSTIRCWLPLERSNIEQGDVFWGKLPERAFTKSYEQTTFQQG